VAADSNVIPELEIGRAPAPRIPATADLDGQSWDKLVLRLEQGEAVASTELALALFEELTMVRRRLAAVERAVAEHGRSHPEPERSDHPGPAGSSGE
jgi:hypothetical protein